MGYTELCLEFGNLVFIMEKTKFCQMCEAPLAKIAKAQCLVFVDVLRYSQ